MIFLSISTELNPDQRCLDDFPGLDLSKAPTAPGVAILKKLGSPGMDTFEGIGEG
jgi:hypothetical protein